VKKLLMLACLIVVLTPLSARAQNDNCQGNEDSQGCGGSKPHMSAVEMTGLGVGGAALVGLAGYLLLRRRHSA
jgi:MYXO-CTERM domain-containing protein